jgi:glutaredoxin|tara:strand:+ start:73 stop:249 length:177 start_codon:yes stop_codon:yes gene_type:complete
MRDKDREAEQDYWDIHLEEEKEHIEKAKAKGEPMLILNEKVVWVNKDYSKFKNVKGGD